MHRAALTVPRETPYFGGMQSRRDAVLNLASLLHHAPGSESEVEAEGLLDEQGVCRYTRGFYDRLPAARAACLKVFALSPEALACVSQRFQLCPFTLSQHLVPWSTVVIGDYNYYYHPMIRLSHFAGGGAWLLLVDEAHNLPARARDMYSGRLSTTDLDHFARQQLSHDAEGKRLLGKFKKRLLQWAGEQAPVTTQLPPRLLALTNELAERLQLPAERRAEVLFEDLELWSSPPEGSTLSR